MLFSWVARWWKQQSPRRRTVKRRSQSSRHLYRPTFEMLEDRITPSTLHGGLLPGFNTIPNPTLGPDNGSSSAISLVGSPTDPFAGPINFFGSQYSSVYVNENGDLTFNGALSAYPGSTGFNAFSLASTSVPMIAPFFANVYTGSPSGQVGYGFSTVNGHDAFGATWTNVNYYLESNASEQNTFQVVLIDRSDIAPGDFDIEFNYSQIQWETGDNSGGTNGLGGQSAVVGFSGGSGTPGTYFQLLGSGVDGSFLNNNSATGLINNDINSSTAGQYDFSMRGGALTTSALQPTAAAAISAGAGNAFTGTVASFTDRGGADPIGNYSATITWGDGNVSAGTINSLGGGAFTVTGTNTYAEQGTDNISVQISDSDNASDTATVTTTATVAASPLATVGNVPFSAVATQPFSGTVASFTDTNAQATNPGAYSATINWGDGTTSAGTIVYTGTPGSFTVNASGAPHTYSAEGMQSSSFFVSIAHANLDAVNTPSVSESVADPAVSPVGAAVSAAIGVSFTGQTVATFTDPGGADLPGNYTATINWGDGTQASNATISYNGSPGSTTGVFTVSGSHTYQHAGSFTVTTTIGHATAASITATSTATVGMGTPTINITDANGVYNTSAFTATATVTGVSGVPGNTLDGIAPTLAYYKGATVSGAALGSAPTQAGTYTVAASFAGDSDYTSSSANLTFIITPATVTGHITVSNLVYNGANTATITGRTLTGAYAADAVSLAGGSATFATAGVATGITVTATGLSLSGAAAGDYTLASTTVTTTANITPAPLTVTATAKSQAYGAAVPALTYTYTGLVNGETSASFTGGLTTAASSSSNVGAYEIDQGTLAATGNYAIGAFNVGTLTVNKASVTYTISNDSQTYGVAAVFATELGATFSTGVNGQNLDIAYSSTGDTTTAHVGAYSITGVASNGTGLLSNYNVTLNPGTLNVNKASISYTISNDSQTYGAAAVFATDLGTTFNTGVNGQNLDIAYGSTGDTASAHVGAYAITGVASNGTGLLSDYNVTLNPGTLNVNKASVSYTISNDSQTYGTAAVFATDLGTTFNTGVNGQNLAIAYSSTGDTTTAHVGAYAITGVASSGTGLLSDYNVTVNPGTLNVNKASVSYTIGNDSQTYGTAAVFATDLGTTFSTGVNGQNLAIAYSSTGDTTTAHVGAYAITGVASSGTGLLSDYNVTVNPGTLNVNKASVSYTIGNDSQTYGDAAVVASDLGTTFSTGVNGQNLAIAYSSTGDATTAHVGAYAITGVASNGTGLLSDYNVTVNPGTLNVNKASVSYTISNDSQTYGTAAVFATDLGTTFNTGVNGQNLAIAYSSIGDTTTAHVGAYAITGVASSGTGLLSDYNVTLNPGTLNVNKASVSYTISNDSQTYGTAAVFATDLGTTFNTGVNGQTLDIAYSSTGDTTSAHVGAYAITGVASDGTGLLSDYNVTLNPGTLNVNKASVSYTIGNDSQTYGAAAVFATDLGTTFSTGVNGQNLAIAYSSTGDATTAHVGAYAITGVASNGTGLLSDYNVTVNPGTLNVNKASVSYTISNDSQTYGTAAVFATDLGTTFNTGVNGQNLAIAYSSTGDTTSAHVGAYAITGVASSGTGLLSDYNVTLNPGTLNVNKASVSYTISNDSQTYGTAAVFATDLGTTFNTGVNGQTLDIAYSSTGDTTSAHVGAYAITGVASDGTGLLSDYNVTLNPGTLNVNKASVSYTISNDGQTYGVAAVFATDLGTTFSTGVNGENLNIAYSSTGDTTSAHVGAYAITGVASNGTGLLSDYNVTVNPGTLNVNKASVSYTISNDSQTYGSAAVFATDLGTTFSTGVNGQTLDIAYSSTGDTTTAHVGAYAITGVASSGTGLLSDYNVTVNPGTLNVNKASVSYTISNDSQTYGTAAVFATDLGTTFNTGVNGQNLDIAYSSTGDTTSAHVGAYAITGVASNGTGLLTDYNVTLNPGTLNVNKASVSYTISNDSQTYGTAAVFATDLGTTFSTGVNGQNLDIAYSSTGDTAAAHVGAYAITGVASDGTGLLSDYNVTLNPGTLNVNKATVSYTIGNDSQTYGAAAVFATDLGTTFNTGVNGQNLDIAYSSTGDTTSAHVGAYAITGVASNGTGLLSDYNVTLNPGTLNVNKASVSYTICNDNQTYGAAAVFATDLGTSFNTGVNGQNLDIAYSSTGDTTSGHVGAYAITGVASSGTGLLSDYNVTINPGTLNVNKASVSYTISNDSQTYGAAAVFATDLGTTLNTGVNGQNLDIGYSSTGDTTAAHVGAYAITGVASNGTGLLSDYNVTLNPGTLNVNKASVSYTISNDSQTYGAAAVFATDLGTTLNTGVNGQNLDIGYSSTGDTTSAHVGAYAITGVASNGTGLLSDYNVTINPGTLNVNKASVSYTISNDSQTYGNAAVFATDLGTTFNTGVNGQNLDIAYSSTGDTASAHVGAYAITGVASNGTGFLSDYNVTINPGTLNVNKASVSYTISNDSQTYGAAAVFATDLGATFNTGVNGQNLDIAYSSTGDTTTAHVGTYAITGVASNGTGLLSDYNVTINPGTLNVNKASVSYTISNDSQIYGSPANLAKDLPATVAGVNGETLAITYSSSGDTSTAVVGNYAITGSLANGTGRLSDYEVTLTPGALTVNPDAFSYTIGNDNQTYGSPANLAKDLPATIGGANGETLAIVYGSSGDSATAHVGSYNITGTLANGSGLLTNYKITLNSGTLTVNPFALTFALGNHSQTYGSPTTLPTTINTGVNGETLAITSSSTGDTATSAAGNYPITGTVSNRTGLTSDYKVTVTNGTLTVNKATLTVAANDLSKTYGIANPTLTDTITGFVNGENAAGAYTERPRSAPPPRPPATSAFTRSRRWPAPSRQPTTPSSFRTARSRSWPRPRPRSSRRIA